MDTNNDITARLRDLEGSQRRILLAIGEVQGTVGTVQGMLETYVDDGSTISRQLALLCAQKHEGVDRKLTEHCEKLRDHDKRIIKIEKRDTRRITEWSAGKKVVVAIGAGVGWLATTFGWGRLVEWLGNITGTE